jgi:hypothetical protein
MRLVETQNKTTIPNRTLAYAERKILPLFKKYCPSDGRPARAIIAAHCHSGKLCGCARAARRSGLNIHTLGAFRLILHLIYYKMKLRINIVYKLKIYGKAKPGFCGKR